MLCCSFGGTFQVSLQKQFALVSLSKSTELTVHCDGITLGAKRLS